MLSTTTYMQLVCAFAFDAADKKHAAAKTNRTLLKGDSLVRFLEERGYPDDRHDVNKDGADLGCSGGVASLRDDVELVDDLVDGVEAKRGGIVD